MADLWMFQDQGGNEYEVDVDTVGGLSKYISQNPSAAPKFRIGGPADTPATPFSGPSSPQQYAQQQAELKDAYPSNYQFEDPWAGRNTGDTSPVPAATPMPTDPQNANRYNDSGVYNWSEGAKPGGGSLFAWMDPRGRQNPDAFATYTEREQFPDAPTGQRYDLGRDYAQETGGYSPGYGTSRMDVPVEGQVKQYGGYSPEDLEAQFEVNPDFDTARTGGRYGDQPAMTVLTKGEYDVAGAGGTSAGPIGKASKDLTVNSAVTNAYMDPNPQNGINVMLDLLKGTVDKDGNIVPLDDASREAVLANIGNLYTAMQTSNPFGYTADTFAQEAILDRASQENVARGGMTQDQALTQQSLDRQMQETIARGGLTARQAALQRQLDEQYRTGQLTNEQAAIEANRFAASEARAGATGSAALQGAATQFAATQAAGAQRDSAEFAANAVTAAAESARLGAKEVAGIQKFSEILQLQGHERMAALANTSAEAIADIERRAAYDVAGANGVSAEAVAAINAGGAEQVAIQQGWSAQQVADIQRQMHAAVADMTNLTETSVANTMAAAQRYAAEQQAAAQMGAANPFGLSSQQFLDMQGEQARGGLTVEERLSEISAANEPERLAALLGALAPGVQGSLQGFGMTAPPTVPTISNLRNTSAERQQYIEGLFGSFGVSPSALVNLIQSVSPGSPLGASTFA